jgi:hypothetical protein
VSAAAIKRWSPWLAKLLWLCLGALSVALHHPWLGGFLLANVALSTCFRLLKVAVYRDEPPQESTKERRLRAMIFAVTLLSGLLVVARVLSPLWR